MYVSASQRGMWLPDWLTNGFIASDIWLSQWVAAVWLTTHRASSWTPHPADLRWSCAAAAEVCRGSAAHLWSNSWWLPEKFDSFVPILSTARSAFCRSDRDETGPEVALNQSMTEAEKWLQDEEMQELLNHWKRTIWLHVTSMTPWLNHLVKPSQRLT